MGGGGGGTDGEPEFQVAPMIDVLLVLLIFFMSITSAQVLKVDKQIKLPLALHGEKRDEKAAAGLINVAWNTATSTPIFKLDDKEIVDTDTENPTMKDSREPIVEMLKKRKANNEKFRMLIRADKAVQAKFLAKVLKWGAEAGIDNIAFSGINRLDDEL
jgi:biopolymer transport protein ExbD